MRIIENSSSLDAEERQKILIFVHFPGETISIHYAFIVYKAAFRELAYHCEGLETAKIAHISV